MPDVDPHFFAKWSKWVSVMLSRAVQFPLSPLLGVTPRFWKSRFYYRHRRAILLLGFHSFLSWEWVKRWVKNVQLTGAAFLFLMFLLFLVFVINFCFHCNLTGERCLHVFTFWTIPWLCVFSIKQFVCISVTWKKWLITLFWSRVTYLHPLAPVGTERPGALLACLPRALPCRAAFSSEKSPAPAFGGWVLVTSVSGHRGVLAMGCALATGKCPLSMLFSWTFPSLGWDWLAYPLHSLPRLHSPFCLQRFWFYSGISSRQHTAQFCFVTQ